MRFFEPKAKFWNWLTDFAGLTIVDCGCGDGDLLRELLNRGYSRAVGVDPRFVMFDLPIPQDLMAAIIPVEAQSLPGLFRAADVVLCCRPCHSGFPAEVMHIIGENTQFLYVGFEHNLDRDVDLGANRARCVSEDVGVDGEDMWLITKKQ